MTEMVMPTPIPLPPSEQFAFPFHIAHLGHDLEMAHRILGPPPYQDFVDGLGDADYWAFTYPCGMRLMFEFIHPLGDGMQAEGNVFGDLPEIQHGLRHLTFPKSVQTPSSIEANNREIEALSTREPWVKPLAHLRAFQVWRHGDDGNQMPVGWPTSERDAKCLIAELESHGHKQSYWFTSR